MKLLDLFCCQGGAAVGYHRAGFEVVGVDINPQPRYPFEFRQMHWSDALTDYGEFDAIHASPPCQAYSVTRHTHSNTHPMLIEPVRVALESTGLPFIIENVPGAPLISPIILCGTMFPLTAVDEDGTNLVLRRHRLFESNVPLVAPSQCLHAQMKAIGYEVAGVYGGGSTDRRHAREVQRGGYTPSKAVRERLMGIDWMALYGLSQSIPPVYTEWIGKQLALRLHQ